MKPSTYPVKQSQRQVYGAYTVSSMPVKAVQLQVSGGVSLWRLFFAAVIFVSIFTLPVLVVSAGYLFYSGSDHLFPGITAGPLAVGGLTRAQAEERVDAYWNRASQITTTDGSRQWSFTPIELGIYVDPKGTVDQAYEIGRGANGPQEVISLIYDGARSVSPVVVFNPQIAQTRLEELAAEVNLPAHNATIRLENGSWKGVAGQNGLSLNVQATLLQIQSSPGEILKNKSFPLVTQAVQPRIPDAAPLMQRLETALEHPLTIQAYDPITDQTIAWSIPREVFDSWVILKNDGEETDFELDAARLAPYLKDWQLTLGSDRVLEAFSTPPQLTSFWLSGQPVKVLIHHLATTYTVQPGDTLLQVAFNVGMPYWKIQQANPEIDSQALTPGQTLIIPSKNDMLPLPVVQNKRIVINISQQRMWTYENGVQRSELIISTGIASSPTMPGVYQVRTHEEDAYASVWDLHMPYFLGIYEGWPGFMNGIHGLPTLSSGQRLWESVLGNPASYGCIILNMQDAADLFSWAENGVIVEIQP